jgi:hypothetical protein
MVLPWGLQRKRRALEKTALEMVARKLSHVYRTREKAGALGAEDN